MGSERSAGRGHDDTCGRVVRGHAGLHVSRPRHPWGFALPLSLLAGCNAIFEISEGTPRPLCADELLIDDLEDGDGWICRTGGRDGAWWVVGDGTTNARLNPRQGASFEPTPLMEGERGTSRYASRFQGSGFTGWGALMGLNLTPFTYDVAGLDGIRFWMRSATPVSIALPTSETVRIRSGGQCDDRSSERACDNHFAFSITAPSRDWAEYRVPFNALRQAGGSTVWNPRHLMNIQVNVPPGAEFDTSVDDLSFVTCGGAECLPTCTDPEFPVSCGEGEGSFSSCQPPGADCAVVSRGLGDPASVAAGGGDPACVGLPGDQPARCFLEGSSGIPFTTRVNPITDGVSNARLRSPEPGKVCMQGTMIGGGAAAISLVVSPIAADFPPLVSDPLDLQALDIRAIEFAITDPPSGGVSLELRGLAMLDCPPDFYCLGPVFSLGGPNASVLKSQTVRAQMAEFEPADPGPTLAWALYFRGHSASRLPENYDFCLEGVKFFDSLGELVTPPPDGGG